VLTTSCADDPSSTLEVDSLSRSSYVATAVSSFYLQHRFETISGLPVDSTSIVFVGNSITHGNEWWECFGDDPRVVNRGVWGTTSAATLYYIENILTGRPDKLVLLIGTNDIQGGTPADTIAANVGLILQRAALESPRTELFVVSIFPSEQGIRTLDEIRRVNALLREECLRRGATYVDLFDDMLGIVDRTLSVDGLHLSADGYARWCAAMAPLLGLNVSLASPVQLDASIAGVAAMRSQLCASLTNSRSDALLIGGEFFTGTQWHELMGTTRVRCRAYGYGYASTPFKLIHSQTSQLLRGGRATEPRAVMFYGCDNEIINLTASPEQMVDSCLALFDEIAAQWPRTALMGLSLLPVRNYQLNQRINRFNSLLCDSLTARGYWYVDINSQMLRADGVTPLYPEMNNDFAGSGAYALVAQTLAPYVAGANPITASRSKAYAAKATARNRCGLILNELLPRLEQLPTAQSYDFFHTAMLTAIAPLQLGEAVTAAQLEEMETQLRRIIADVDQCPADGSGSVEPFISPAENPRELPHPQRPPGDKDSNPPLQ
jgi:lysophospholipase L1-like esterase